MALPFLSTQPKKKDQIIAVDLGARTTKAVYFQRKAEVFYIHGFSIQDAPSLDKPPTTEMLAEHLKGIVAGLGGRCKNVALAVGVNDAFLRQAELPMIPIPDMRMMLKFSAKNYLQQDYADHIFDCHLLPPRGAAAVEAARAPQRCRVLVSGAKRQFIEGLQESTKAAGLFADAIVPCLASPVNAFERAQPMEFANEVVALVDLGFKSSVITILLQGELAMTRVVSFGGDKLTTGVAEGLGVSYAEAEGIKVGLPEEVHSVMQALLMPLGRELRASIDFFEHQNDRQVAQVFLSGAASRSDFIMQTLQAELMVPCKPWNCISPYQMALTPQQMAEIEHISPQLTVAVGAAMAVF